MPWEISRAFLKVSGGVSPSRQRCTLSSLMLHTNLPRSTLSKNHEIPNQNALRTAITLPQSWLQSDFALWNDYETWTFGLSQRVSDCNGSPRVWPVHYKGLAVVWPSSLSTYKSSLHMENRAFLFFVLFTSSVISLAWGCGTSSHPPSHRVTVPVVSALLHGGGTSLSTWPSLSSVPLTSGRLVC